MQLVKSDINLDFIGKIKAAGILSLLLILVSAGSLLIHGGPRYGIDFAGGTLVQIKFTTSMTTAEVRNALAAMGSEDASVQPFGNSGDNEFLINIPQADSELEGLTTRITDQFSQRFGAAAFEIRRVEMVGPKVGTDLRRKGMLAVVCSLLGMLIYIWWRFEFRFGIGAIIALTHDVIITLGALSLTNTAIDLPIIAALLTVVGYSVNDTIIVCDRIRENRRKMLRESLAAVINTSINQTLSRTLMTSVTTLLVIITLLIFGGGVIHDFAFTLMIGVVIGTYSSIYIASPILILWERAAEKRAATRGKK